MTTKTKIKPKTKLEKKHWYHTVISKRCSSGPHYGKIVCVDCGKVMRWVSEKDYHKL